MALPAVSVRSRAGPAPRGVGTAALQRGSVSHGPAALATLRPCELLPVGALSRGSRGTRGGLELEMKPPAGWYRRDVLCSRDPKAPWYLWWHNPQDQGPSPSLLEREVVSTLPPAERKVSLKPLKRSARATIYPGHFPEPSPRPAPSAPASRLSPARLFAGRTQRAAEGAAWQPLYPPNSAAPTLPAPAPTERQGAHLQPLCGC